MSKGIYFGVGGTAKKVKGIYIGIGGVAKKVTKAYIGVNGVAKQFYSADTPQPGTMTLAEEKAAFSASSYSWDSSSGSGRGFARCLSNVGTIMRWNDNGTTRYTVVLDAAYRTAAMIYSNQSTNLSLTTHQNVGYISSTGASTSLPAVASNFTDTILNSLSASNQDSRSSTVATNEWANSSYYGSSMPAVYYVRNTLSGTSGIMLACDLPTVNCLARIYGDMTKLDSMDPTISTSPGSSNTLCSWVFSGYSSAWCSSWFGYYYGAYRGLRILGAGYVQDYLPTDRWGVVPVLEF